MSPRGVARRAGGVALPRDGGSRLRASGEGRSGPSSLRSSRNSPMTAAMLNIAALSRRTGVAPDTLRKWEQRYGVLRPSRTSGGQRRYSDLDVDRVEWLRARLAEGYRIGEAAALLGGDEAGAPRSPDDFRRELLTAVAGNATAELERLLDQ